MPTESKRTDNTQRNWIIGIVIALVAIYFVWNAANPASSDSPIYSTAEYQERLAEAEKLSLDNLERFDRGEPLDAKAKAELAQAAKIFDRLSEVQAKNIAPFVGAGKIYQTLDQDELAVQRFTQGLATVPKDPIDAILDTAIETHHLLSISYFKLHKYDAALQESSVAIKMFKQNSPIYLTQRARVYLEQRNYVRAMRDLVVALDTDADYAPARSLVKLYIITTKENAKDKLNSQDYKGAVEESSVGLLFDPKSTALLAMRCAGYLGLGQKDKAKADYDMIAFLDPDSDDAKKLAPKFK